jgi:ligand-binding sensor domain-containing protein
MPKNGLMRQGKPWHKKNDLRALLKQYLEKGDAPEDISWESLTTADGLPHNWIYDLYQASDGKIYVGTWGGGLAVLDGGQWRTYKKRDGLASNAVTCIREGRDGRIWLATDNGLNVLAGGQISDGGLYDKSLLNLTFDRQGNLWAGCWRATHSGGGLYRFDGRDWQSFTTRDGLPGQEILKVFEDSKGRIWVGTYEHGMGAGVGWTDGNRWHNYNHSDGLADNCVYTMFEDPSGNMWFGTIKGISIFDGRKWHYLSTRDGLVDNRIYCMWIDSNKKMWFGTEKGISRFDGTNWISYRKKDGLVEDLVRTILETREHDLWFGTYPYTQGRGGISIARFDSMKSLKDRVLDLLPEPEDKPRLESGDQDETHSAKGS